MDILPLFMLSSFCHNLIDINKTQSTQKWLCSMGTKKALPPVIEIPR